MQPHRSQLSCRGYGNNGEHRIKAVVQHCKHRCVCVHAMAAKQAAQQQPVVAVDPAVARPPQGAQWTSAVPIAAAAVISFSAAYFTKGKSETTKKQQLEPWPEIPSPDADPKAYRLALARTRQALDVQRAVAYMKAGEHSRALLELHRALEENAVCRCPLLDGHHTKGDLRDLYKLNLLNTTVPHNFATLLQLRELLGLSAQEGEDLEVEVLQTGAAFDI